MPTLTAAPRSLGGTLAVTTAGPRRRFLLLFLCCFLLTGSWALATPPFAAPDEPAHVYRASAVVRGHLVPSPDQELGDGRAAVEVPAGLVESANRIGCYVFRPEVPASCAGDPDADDRLAAGVTSAARYHPVYYAAVGWPTLFLSDNSAVFAMRLASAFLVSLLLASGLSSAFEHPRSRLVILGSTMAMTPMVLFLGGTVNPNSVEIAGGFAVWGAGLALIASDDPARQRILLRRLAVAAAVMVTARSISPLWLLLILGALAALAGRRRLVELLGRRFTWFWGGVVGAATLVSVAWTVLAGANPVPPERADKTSFLDAVGLSLAVMPQRLDQYIGRFGWLDAHSPSYSLVVITAALGFVVVLGLVLGRRTEALVVAGLLAAVVALPVVIEAVQFNSTGYFWQSRYQLPLAVGIPMVAMAAVRPAGSSDPWSARVPLVLLPPVLLGHLLCFVWALRRYQIGSTAPLDVLGGSWAPRIGTWTAIGMHGLGLLALGLLVIALVRSLGRDSAVPVGAGGSTDAEAGGHGRADGSHEGGEGRSWDDGATVPRRIDGGSMPVHTAGAPVGGRGWQAEMQQPRVTREPLAARPHPL